MSFSSTYFTTKQVRNVDRFLQKGKPWNDWNAMVVQGKQDKVGLLITLCKIMRTGVLISRKNPGYSTK